GDKPSGANLYPADMTEEELDTAAADNHALKDLYTMVRRDDAGNLTATPYHEFFSEQMQVAAAKLRQAALLADEGGLRRYLELRAEALLSGDYQPSDLAWMDMKDNTIDVVIGPIETYEDQLVGAKAAAETYVLIKDQAWSQRLARYAELLPRLQEGLPVPDDYKQETPGSNSDLGVYDAIYYAGDGNAGSKTIAINLPNDEQVQLQKGTRRLQLKNAMRAKFDKILLPIAGVLIAEDQRPHVTFDAFFGNTMFHEVAHGLGIKNTLTGQGTVREALRNHASSLEEGKADVLGLYMVISLSEQGEWDGVMMEHYVTFFTSIFRSIRFGLSSAHGRANLIRFNYFKDKGAFTREAATGVYRIDIEQMKQAANDLSEEILRLQGDGDYDAVDAFVGQYLVMGDQLQADLDRLAELGIPRDIVFEQGLSVLGLEPTTSP
ncbi:MAG: Zn-dependent hydrolase, partial [Rhodothermales bacterium]